MTTSLDYSEIAEQVSKTNEKNPFVWIVTNLKLPKGMQWDFRNRLWQIAIINDLAKEQVTIKPAQVGMSTISLAKVFWVAYHVPMRVAYTLPRNKDVTDMVPTRVDPMIAESPILQLKMGGTKGPDSVRIKQIDQSFIHFMESSTEPRMLDIDFLVNDEVDLSDQNQLDKFQARLYASHYKLRYQLSTPSVPNFGIDDLIKSSDWKVWQTKCPFCGKWIVFDENWHTLMKVRSHRIYYGADCCDSCKDIGLSPADINAGTWVPKYPSQSRISGYQVVRTMDPMTSAKDLYIQWKKTRSERNFYNLALGLPYVAGGITMSKDYILQNNVDPSVENESYAKEGGRYFVGIDQGNNLHMVVMKQADNDSFEMVYADVLSDKNGDPFTEAIKICKRFGKNTTIVCDMLPNKHSAVNMQKQFNKNMYLAYFNPSAVGTGDEFFKLSDRDKTAVGIQKHDAMDELVNSYLFPQKIKFYTKNGRYDDNIEMVATHFGNIQRTVRARNIQGVGERIFASWEATGPDHFAMSTLYALTAANIRAKHRSNGFSIRLLNI